jgi:methionyl-tRNA synthetase
VETCFRELALHKALMAIWEFVGIVNKTIVEKEPWVLAKDPVHRGRLDAILYNLLEALRVTAVLIGPFMPGSAARILGWLGIANPAGEDFATLRAWGGLKAGNTLQRGETLFPRVELKAAAAEQRPAPIAAPQTAAPIKPEISYEEFAKVDLRTAKVLAAERVPKSSKLLKLTVEIDGPRTIVAGMGKEYSPEEIVGKTIVVVANLAPAKLMGVESHGMLLATDTEGGLTLLGFDRPPKTGVPIH